MSEGYPASKDSIRTYEPETGVPKLYKVLSENGGSVSFPSEIISQQQKDFLEWAGDSGLSFVEFIPPTDLTSLRGYALVQHMYMNAADDKIEEIMDRIQNGEYPPAQ